MVLPNTVKDTGQGQPLRAAIFVVRVTMRMTRFTSVHPFAFPAGLALVVLSLT